MAMFAEADAEARFTAVALTVTKRPLGIAAGAVEEVVAVLPVLVAGLNEPHEFKGVHDQVTPELVESLPTTAVRVVLAPGFSEVGGAGLNETETGGGGVMVMV